MVGAELHLSSVTRLGQEFLCIIVCRCACKIFVSKSIVPIMKATLTISIDLVI